MKSDWAYYAVYSEVTYQGNELTQNWSWNAPPRSSQLAESLWTDPGPESGIGVHEIISTLRKKNALGD